VRFNLLQTAAEKANTKLSCVTTAADYTNSYSAIHYSFSTQAYTQTLEVKHNNKMGTKSTAPGLKYND